jgi:dTDP-4-dehydrorhamnose reductase
MTAPESPVTTRWVVVGAGGMLGQDLLAVLATGPDDVTALTRTDLDITDLAAVTKALDGAGPGAVVVNCAAWTAVDDAETHESDAFAINAVGPANLARACALTGARLVQVSTDYVFDGTGGKPYDEFAPLAPRSAYGRTKAAGEWAVRAELPGRHWIVRTAWLYGLHGRNFVATMRRLAAERPTVDVITDQIGQPTWSADLAAQIVAMVRAGAPSGTYHGTSSGRASWFEFAQAVFAGIGADPSRVHPTTSAAFVLPAPRPAWSVLGHCAWVGTGVEPIRAWNEALAAFLAVSAPDPSGSSGTRVPRSYA